MQNEQDGRQRPGKSLRAKILLILTGLFFGLMVMEVALRIIGYSYPIWYATDPDRGYGLRAGVAGWYRREGGSYVRINSEGLRDREHARQKPANTFRIAVLGDSFSEAMHVSMEETYWALLESKLKDCPALQGRNVEVINFGVSGYGTAQELITLRRKVWDYQPDMVMLAMTTFNDISDNSRALKKTEEIPYFVFSNNQLVLDDSFLQSRTYRRLDSRLNRLGRAIRDGSRVFQALHNAQFAFKRYLEERRARKVLAAQQQERQTQSNQAPPAIAKIVDFGIYEAPTDPAWIDAWRVTEGLIATMRDEVRARGAEFLVVILSNDVQVLPKQQSRENFIKGIGGGDLFYANRRLKEFCEREGIDVLSIAEPMLAYAEQHEVYLHGFGREIGNGHWNPAGHAVAAGLITEKVCEMQGALR